MPDTKRQQIVDQLKLRLAAISTANGYQTDIGSNGGHPIDEWPTQYQEEELLESTRLGLFDLVASKPQGDVNQEEVTNRMPCQVRLFHKRGTTPAELRVMMADVEKSLITNPDTNANDPELDGVAIGMLSDEVGFIVTDNFQIDGAAIQFDVLFVTEPFNAYQ